MEEEHVITVDPSHHTTLVEWLTMLRKSAFINDYTAEVYTKRTLILGVCTIISMFALAIISACSVSLLGASTLPSFPAGNQSSGGSSSGGSGGSSPVITGETAVWVTVAFNIATLIITALLGAIHSIKELFGWDDLIRELREYVKDAISLAGTVEIQITLNGPAPDFIQSFSEKMIAFRNSAPNIGTTNFVNGEARWNDYIANPKSVKMMMICDQRL